MSYIYTYCTHMRTSTKCFCQHGAAFAVRSFRHCAGCVARTTRRKNDRLTFLQRTAAGIVQPCARNALLKNRRVRTAREMTPLAAPQSRLSRASGSANRCRIGPFTIVCLLVHIAGMTADRPVSSRRRDPRRRAEAAEAVVGSALTSVDA